MQQITATSIKLSCNSDTVVNSFPTGNKKVLHSSFSAWVLCFLDCEIILCIIQEPFHDLCLAEFVTQQMSGQLMTSLSTALWLLATDGPRIFNLFCYKSALEQHVISIIKQKHKMWINFLLRIIIPSQNCCFSLFPFFLSLFSCMCTCNAHMYIAPFFSFAKIEGHEWKPLKLIKI